jgi:hypothetical protein
MMIYIMNIEYKSRAIKRLKENMFVFWQRNNFNIFALVTQNGKYNERTDRCLETFSSTQQR